MTAPPTPSTSDAPGTVDPSMFREYDIRGFVEQNFTAPVLLRLGRAFGTFLSARSGRSGRGPGAVAVGRDVRLSSAAYAGALIEGLRATGADVTDIGMVPTPLVYFAVNTLPADAGAAVTASHNPPEYNGLKLRERDPALPNGLPLQPEEIQELRRLAQGGASASGAVAQRGGQGALRGSDVQPAYVDYVRQRITLPRRLKVVVDAGNGAAGPVAVRTLEAIGCEVVPLYCDPDGTFPNHMPDPLKPENLRDLIARVKETEADLGLALDGDGDRLGVVDDQGQILEADRYLILLARGALREHPGGSVVFDVKCSMALIEAIERMGGRPVMSRTGYPNIMARRREVNAVLAGELSGHIFFNDPVIDFDDGTFAGASLLQALALEGRPLSEIVAGLPRYHSTPEERFYCPDDQKVGVVERLRDAFAADPQTQSIIDLDGARVTFEGGWGLVRASNTEPALTTRFEAVTPERTEEIRQAFLLRLSRVPAVDLTRSGH
ncbi:MAG TPA: phosphomannomutase/phosphoglucomutase [Chloroflexota bacterium]|nr:phosphomannomutase/phosphoglucomutase [Chloroflexota bacterium]